MTKEPNNQIYEIYEPVLQDMTEVQSRIQGLVQGQEQHMHDLVAYLFERGGKGLRPALTLLASKLNSNKSDKSISMAIAIELLHIATLIHDDTVDNSTLRRGQETISSHWGQNIAILLGDYIFATSARFVCDTESIRVIKRFSETIMELSSGQIMEFFTSHSIEQHRKTYEDRIYRKTASLFRTASEAGAILGGAEEWQVKQLNNYGYNIGMAFQIVDDVLDVQATSAQLGKPVGNDLIQGIITLPTLLLMELGPKPSISITLKEVFSNPESKVPINKILGMIQDSDIIEKCYAEAEQYCQKARDNLADLPESGPKKSLELLSYYITKRHN